MISTRPAPKHGPTTWSLPSPKPWTGWPPVGDVPREWTWAGYTPPIHHRPLGQSDIAPLSWLSTAARSRRGGSLTVDAADFDYAEPFTVSSLASYRQIIDLADFDLSRSVHTTGQSGNPSIRTTPT